MSLYYTEGSEKSIWSVWREDFLKYFSLAKFDRAASPHRASHISLSRLPDTALHYVKRSENLAPRSEGEKILSSLCIRATNGTGSVTEGEKCSYLLSHCAGPLLARPERSMS